MTIKSGSTRTSEFGSKSEQNLLAKALD